MTPRTDLVKLIISNFEIPAIPRERKLLALSYDFDTPLNERDRIEEYTQRRNNMHYETQASMVKPPRDLSITREPIQPLTQKQIEFQRINSGRKYQHRSLISKAA